MLACKRDFTRTAMTHFRKCLLQKSNIQGLATVLPRPVQDFESPFRELRDKAFYRLAAKHFTPHALAQAVHDAIQNIDQQKRTQNDYAPPEEWVVVLQYCDSLHAQG